MKKITGPDGMGTFYFHNERMALLRPDGSLEEIEADEITEMDVMMSVPLARWLHRAICDRIFIKEEEPKVLHKPTQRELCMSRICSRVQDDDILAWADSGEAKAMCRRDGMDYGQWRRRLRIDLGAEEPTKEEIEEDERIMREVEEEMRLREEAEEAGRAAGGAADPE